MFKLSEEIQAAAFRVHSYHHEVIGDMADLETIQREDLYNHYRRYYLPNNSIVAVAGDFETEAMLARLRELYETIPAGPEPLRRTRPEPAQPGQRQVMVEGPGETTYVQLAHRVPPASHPDFFPLTVLDSLLTGPSNLNMFGGGISNKTSLLYRRLVEQELAVAVYGGLQATIDPYLHAITAIVHPASSAEAVVAAVETELEKLQNAPPDEANLHRAVKQARALFAYGSESISNQAFWLGFAEMFADYEWFTTYLDNLAAVTPGDVQRVAQTYFRPQQRVLGVYLPTGGDETGPGDLE
jgi:zinc protease